MGDEAVTPADRSMQGKQESTLETGVASTGKAMRTESLRRTVFQDQVTRKGGPLPSGSSGKRRVVVVVFLFFCLFIFFFVVLDTTIYVHVSVPGEEGPAARQRFSLGLHVLRCKLYYYSTDIPSV